MAIVHFAVASVALGFAAYGIYSWKDRPIRLRSFDEVDCIRRAAAFATQRLNLPPQDRTLFYSNLLWRDWWIIWFPWSVRLPIVELTALAPFIDGMIEGHGPPLNLPPEYEDYRPRVLAAFKARMEAEGLWPA